MALKLPDSAVPMGDFPVAKAVDIDFNDGENLQEKLDNGKLGGGGNTTDLTEINTKLTQLETKTASSILRFPFWNGSTDVYLKIPAPTTLSKQSPFITVTSSHGGCIIILAGDSQNDYRFTKCVRIANDNIFSHDASIVGTQKLLNVYADRVNGYIYIKLGANGSVGITGINEAPVSEKSLPEGVSEVPILDLTQGNTTVLTDLENRVTTNKTNITDLENRVTTNKTNITDLQEQTSDLQEQMDNLDIPDITEINTKLTQLETKTASSILRFPFWNGSTDVYLKIPAPTTLSKQSPFITVTSSHGGCIIILAGDSQNDYRFTKCVRIANDNIFSHDASIVGTQKLLNVYADRVNGYIYIKLGANGSVSIMGINEAPVCVTTLPTDVIDEVLIVDLTQGNTRGDIYRGEIEVGTWTGGQKLYRYTISDNTERTISNSGVLRVDFLPLSRDKYTVVKLDGTLRMCSAGDNSDAYTVYTLPYCDLETKSYAHLVYTPIDNVILSCVNLANYKIVGFEVSVYYYEK